MSCSTMISVLPSDTRADQRHGVLGLAVAHAGGRLVEQDDLGAAGDGDADLERPLLGIGQQAGRQVAPRRAASAARAAVRPPRSAPSAAQQVPERVAVALRPQQAAADVLEHRHAREDRGDLEAARQAQPVDLVRRQAGRSTGRSAAIVPEVTESAPLIRLNSVVLPAPLGPIMAWRSPRGMSRSTPRMISVGPKLLRTPRSSTRRRAHDTAPCALASLDQGVPARAEAARLAPQPQAAEHERRQRDQPGQRRAGVDRRGRRSRISCPGPRRWCEGGELDQQDEAQQAQQRRGQACAGRARRARAAGRCARSARARRSARSARPARTSP